jgi:hypothetical protein
VLTMRESTKSCLSHMVIAGTASADSIIFYAAVRFNGFVARHNKSTFCVRAINRPTVVWVQTFSSLGVSTPRSVSARASDCRDVIPASLERSTSSSSLCAARSAARRRAAAAAPLSGRPLGGPVAPRPAQTGATSLRRCQRSPCALADEFTFFLRHRRVDPHHQIVRAWHVGGAN